MSGLLLAANYVLLFAWITGFIYRFRKRLTCMVGMMGAMALGMTIGLGIGSLLTAWLPGQFYHSVMFSMIIGGAVGIIAGLPVSLMAVMDGLLSGLMGGMMGAMLVVMVPESNVEATVKMIALLCSGIIFLLLLVLQGEVTTEHLKKQWFLMSTPAPMFFATALFLILIFQTETFSLQRQGQIPSSTFLVPNAGINHKHGAPSGQQESTEEADKELVVKAREFSFTPAMIQISVNEKVRVVLNNSGQVEHDFEIVGTDIHIHSQPGMKSFAIVQFNKAGEYKAICTIPGHKEAGMFATIDVNN